MTITWCTACCIWACKVLLRELHGTYFNPVVFQSLAELSSHWPNRPFSYTFCDCDLATDPATFMNSSGLSPAGIESDRDCTESEDCSLDEGGGVDCWEAFIGSLPDQVPPADAIDELFGRWLTKSRLDRTTWWTSLFSKRTRWRWVLGLRGTMSTSAHEGAPAGGFGHFLAPIAERRSSREGLRS
jgi:hypothetical protein